VPRFWGVNPQKIDSRAGLVLNESMGSGTGKNRRRHSIAASLAVLATCLTVVGCGSESRLYPVVGRVTFDGQTLTSGSVEFVALDGANYGPVGNIAADGTYRLVTFDKEGAPLGKYKVLVRSVVPSNPNDPYSIPQSLIPEKYNKAEETGLQMEVVSNPGPDAYDIALVK
jgi:hypothetical protein